MTNRRQFVRATLSAAALGPTILHAQDKAGARRLLTGSGQHTYEVIPDWARLPAGRRFGNTHAVVEDSQGRILIHHQGPESVCIFDPDGRFIKSWGSQWQAGAHGMQLRKEGSEEFLYLATTNQHLVVKTNLDGEVVFKLEYPRDAKDAAGNPCYADGGRYNPTNIALAPNGDFYVADGYGSNFIHQYDIQGQYIRTFGGTGTGDGQLRCPHGIWCDTRADQPKLLVADRANERLVYFSLDGRHHMTIKPADNAFRHPCHFDQRGQELLLPGLHGRVSILDADNVVVAVLGDNADARQRGRNDIPRDQRSDGIFVSPHGACFDRAGNIFVTEWLFDGRVTKLRRVA